MVEKHRYISKVSFDNLYYYAIAKPDVTLPDSRPISSEIVSYVPYLTTAPLVDVLSFSQSHSSEASNKFPMHEAVPYPSSYSKRDLRGLFSLQGESLERIEELFSKPWLERINIVYYLRWVAKKLG